MNSRIIEIKKWVGASALIGSILVGPGLAEIGLERILYSNVKTGRIDVALRNRIPGSKQIAPGILSLPNGRIVASGTDFEHYEGLTLPNGKIEIRYGSSFIGIERYIGTQDGRLESVSSIGPCRGCAVYLDRTASEGTELRKHQEAKFRRGLNDYLK